MISKKPILFFAINIYCNSRKPLLLMKSHRPRKQQISIVQLRPQSITLYWTNCQSISATIIINTKWGIFPSPKYSTYSQLRSASSIRRSPDLYGKKLIKVSGARGEKELPNFWTLDRFRLVHVKKSKIGSISVLKRRGIIFSLLYERNFGARAFTRLISKVHAPLGTATNRKPSKTGFCGFAAEIFHSFGGGDEAKTSRVFFVLVAGLVFRDLFLSLM